MNTKGLDEMQRKCVVWDVERGHSNIIEPNMWQTDTCIGTWHYSREFYEKGSYKTPKTVIHTLAGLCMQCLWVRPRMERF
jgi:alpha-L-fucosidase